MRTTVEDHNKYVEAVPTDLSYGSGVILVNSKQIRLMGSTIAGGIAPLILFFRKIAIQLPRRFSSSDT
jgi:hypothetical protein